MTIQQTFDIVAAHLISMRKAAKSDDGIDPCYRGPNGEKCAIGILIEDDDYYPEMEGKPITDHFVREALWGKHNVPLLVELQNIHDEHFDIRIPKLRELAKRYKISDRILDEGRLGVYSMGMSNEMKRIEISQEDYLEYTRDYLGICIKCGEVASEVEPDAEKYECQYCDECAVYGTEQALLEGFILITE